MFKDSLDEFMYLLRENIGGIFICLSLVFYMVSLFNLTCLGSPLFVVFSYAGTILLTLGFMAKTEIFPTKLKLRGIIFSVLLFASVLIYTTAAIVLFLDTKMIITISQMVPIGGYAWTQGPYRDPLGGFHTHFIRPYAWLFVPLLVIGTIFAVAAFIMLYTNEGG